jgi:hypothetical protein
MTNIINRISAQIKALLGKTGNGAEKPGQPQNSKTAAAPTSAQRLNETALIELMHKLEQTQENMYSCEESFALLDEYVDMFTTGEDAARLMPLVENHLNACPECKEHYDILLDILHADTT